MAQVTISLDVGDVRIGVAISRSGVIAEPLVTIEFRGRRQVLDELQAIVDREKVTRCIIGLPYLESGAEGEQAGKSRAFGRSLARRLPQLQIEFSDERYTSGQAREMVAERAHDNRESGIVDRVAAAIILQEYLDLENFEKEKKLNASNSREHNDGQ